MANKKAQNRFIPKFLFRRKGSDGGLVPKRAVPAPDLVAGENLNASSLSAQIEEIHAAHVADSGDRTVLKFPPLWNTETGRHSSRKESLLDRWEISPIIIDDNMFSNNPKSSKNPKLAKPLLTNLDSVADDLGVTFFTRKKRSRPGNINSALFQTVAPEYPIIYLAATDIVPELAEAASLVTLENISAESHETLDVTNTLVRSSDNIDCLSYYQPPLKWLSSSDDLALESSILSSFLNKIEDINRTRKLNSAEFLNTDTKLCVLFSVQQKDDVALSVDWSQAELNWNEEVFPVAMTGLEEATFSMDSSIPWENRPIPILPASVLFITSLSVALSDHVSWLALNDREIIVFSSLNDFPIGWEEVFTPTASTSPEIVLSSVLPIENLRAPFQKVSFLVDMGQDIVFTEEPVQWAVLFGSSTETKDVLLLNIKQKSIFTPRVFTKPETTVFSPVETLGSLERNPVMADMRFLYQSSLPGKEPLSSTVIALVDNQRSEYSDLPKSFEISENDEVGKVLENGKVSESFVSHPFELPLSSELLSSVFFGSELLGVVLLGDTSLGATSLGIESLEIAKEETSTLKSGPVMENAPLLMENREEILAEDLAPETVASETVTSETVASETVVPEVLSEVSAVETLVVSKIEESALESTSVAEPEERQSEQQEQEAKQEVSQKLHRSPEEQYLERLLGRPLTLADREEYYWEDCEEKSLAASASSKKRSKSTTRKIPPFSQQSFSQQDKRKNIGDFSRDPRREGIKEINGNLSSESDSQKPQASKREFFLVRALRFPFEMIGHSIIITGRTLKRTVKHSSKIDPVEEEEMNRTIRKKNAGAFSDTMISVITGTLIAVGIVFPSLRLVGKEVYDIILKSTVRKIGEKVQVPRGQDPTILMPLITNQMLFPKSETTEFNISAESGEKVSPASQTTESPSPLSLPPSSSQSGTNE